MKEEDADSLQEMIDNPNVYKYEPSFLFEKRYDDVHYVIDNKKPQKPLNFRGFSTSMRLDLNQRPLRPEPLPLKYTCVLQCPSARQMLMNQGFVVPSSIETNNNDNNYFLDIF